MFTMISTTANIYISVGQALHHGSDESQGYHRQKHTYLISVEPHHFRVPGMPHHEATLTHFEAIKEPTSGMHGLAKYTSKDSPGIIGNILISESAHTTVEKVHKILSERLAASAASEDAYADDEDEHRLRTFIHALQEHEMVVRFKVDEFVLWTHSYLMDRLNNEAPALIAYPRAHRDYEQKASKHKFWITYPMADKTRTNSHGEATVYGGLM